MAGLPWIKVWTAIGAHPKVQRLEKELGLKDALGMVVRLWCWTADYCPSGDIPEADGPSAAKAARGDACRKSPEDVLRAMVTSDLLDRTPEGFRVHDWHDMQTIHVDAEEKRKSQARDRQAAYRARHGIGVKVTPVGPRDVTRDVTRDSVTEREREKETEKEATTPPRIDMRAEGAAARLAITNGLQSKDEVLATKYPRTAQLIDACHAVKCQALWSTDSATRAVVESAIGDQAIDAAMVERVTVDIAETGKPWLGHHVAVIRGKTKTRDVRSAIAAPASHEAFGQGGERVID
jgi:hypothetical protein